MRLIAFLAVLALAFPALARQDDARLNDLFATLKTQEDPRAVKLLETAIWGVWMQSGSDTLDLLLTRGTQAMGAGDYPTALQLFTSITELDPNFAEGWNKRATLFYLMGAYDRSAADVDKTLALEPRHFGALSGLGMINMQLGKEKEALDAFEKALAVNPHMDSIKSEVNRLKKKLEGSRI
jgi:tetratricopeptide (TPR) repeat protein